LGEKENSEVEGGNNKSGDWDVVGESLEGRVCEECGKVEVEYHFVECERGRLARDILILEVGEKVVGKEDLFKWVLGGFVRDGIEWGVVVEVFEKDLGDKRGFGETQEG